MSIQIMRTISITVNIICILISILLGSLYILKKRISTKENQVYSALLMCNILCLILELLFYTICYINKNELIVNIIGKSYFALNCIWMFINFLYIMIISKKDDKFKLSKLTVGKKKIIVSSLILGIFLLVLILPIEHIYDEGRLISSVGPAINFVFLLCFVFIFLNVWFIISARRQINKSKIAPILVFVGITFIELFLNAVGVELFLMTLPMTIVCFLMYHTIENPDVKMIEQLNIAKIEAERANSAKTDFLSSMSHEIRTPLNAIMGFSECIIKSNDLETAKEDAKDIVMASQNLLEIVNGILDISKIEAGKMELVETNYDLVQIGNDLAKLMIPRIGEKPIELKINFAKDIPGVLYGDGGKLKQVMTNILTNAVKYTEKGSITFDINCINEKNICKLIISVEDTGRGIKPEKINTLFNKFERLDEDKNTTLEGTGLGLAITKKMVEMLNGKIIVQSKYGIGSKFTVYLAQTIVSMQRQVVEEEKTEISTFDNKKILLVDDNTLNIKIAVRLLNEYNLNITSLDNGFSCIDKINSGEIYDLILLDDMMPKMSGTETLHKLKEIPNFNIPVVVLTANAIDGMKENYLKEGFNDYLSKPIEKHELTRVLNKFLLGNNSEVEELDDLEFMNEEVIIIEDEETGSNTNNIDYLIENNIDVNTSLELLGDIEMYNETLDIFYDEINDKTSKMKEYKDSDNLKEYATLVHSIKSDSKYLGFTNLAKMSLDHELKAKENDSVYIKENYDSLIIEINKIINIIKVYLNK